MFVCFQPVPNYSNPHGSVLGQSMTLSINQSSITSYLPPTTLVARLSTVASITSVATDLQIRRQLYFVISSERRAGRRPSRESH